MWSVVPGEGEDVVYERGAVLACKSGDVAGQSTDKSSPALVSVVDDVEACVSVVQLEPLYGFWKLKSR